MTDLQSQSTSTRAPPAVSPLHPDILLSPIHLRPVQHSDLAQILAIYSHYIINSVAIMIYNPPSMEYMAGVLEMVQAERLPFIVAAAASTAGADSAESATTAATVNNEDSLVLGFMYVTPYHHHTGMAVRSVATSTYIHPEIRKSGIGGRLTCLMLNLLKYPSRYTTPSSPIASSSFCATACKGYEETLPTYSAWHNVHLRPVHTVVRYTVIDTEGIGKGKERFYEKWGFYEVGIIKGCAEKFGKAWDVRMWAMQLEDWDEVEGRPKMKGGLEAGGMDGAADEDEDEEGKGKGEIEGEVECEGLGHLLIKSML